MREVLRARGGVWITADVYVRHPTGPSLFTDARARRFLEEHRVEENKFASWDAAEAFFARQGFSVRQRLAPSEEGRRTCESWMLAPPATDRACPPRLSKEGASAP